MPMLVMLLGTTQETWLTQRDCFVAPPDVGTPPHLSLSHQRRDSRQREKQRQKQRERKKQRRQRCLPQPARTDAKAPRRALESAQERATTTHRCHSHVNHRTDHDGWLPT